MVWFWTTNKLLNFQNIYFEYDRGEEENDNKGLITDGYESACLVDLVHLTFLTTQESYLGIKVTTEYTGTA